MPPNSSGVPKSLLKPSMRRGGPPVAGSNTPLALQRSEFEDFMNAYRPTLDLPRREPPPPRPAEEPKVDFGRSIKKLMKRPQGSPNVQNKNRKEGIQRTPTVSAAIASRSDKEKGIITDVRPQSEKKPKRPLSAQIDMTLIPPQPAFGHGPTVMVPLDANLVKPEAIPPQPVVVQPIPVTSPPPPKNSKPVGKVSKNGLEEQIPHIKVVPESAAALSAAPVVLPAPNQVKKKVSIQEEKRRSGTESFSDALCLIITGNNIGRFLPPRHNPDPILNMRVVPIPERKYHVILEFEESPLPPRPSTSNSGLVVITPEENVRDSREQVQFFSWIRESHVASMGMLLGNVERLTEFPYVTYLVVGGGGHELSQKLNFVGDRNLMDSHRQLHFIAGYEETITISRPPLATFPEKPASDKTGFVISLYQVLPGDDGIRFEQNWVMWTGARQLYRTVPEYMGLKRISVHKSFMPTHIINYVLICEFSNIMDHLTDACVIIDHLRARCCGFTGIYRVLESL